MLLTPLSRGRRGSSSACRPHLRARATVIHGLLAMLGLAILSGATSLSATILWHDPGAVLVHEYGPGRDILNGAVKRDDSSRDTLYFRLHISPLSDSNTEEYFAGL